VSGDNGGKAYHETSVFIPENLLHEARRQRGLGDHPVPDVCVLDPDGDIVRHLRATGRATRQTPSAVSVAGAIFLLLQGFRSWVIRRSHFTLDFPIPH
jgi:hypothetical protein